MQFFRVKTPEDLKKELLSIVKPLESEPLDIESALGRILASDVLSPVDLPDFARSTMDGFAVRAQDTFGASSSLGAYLKVVGEVLMGEKANLKVASGEAVKVATGGMLPDKADAVVMIEHTDAVDETLIEVTKPVAPGENVVKVGEDVNKDEVILHKGHELRPQDIGALAGLGILSVEVYRQPRVSVISTGDEVIEPEEIPEPGQIRDINTYSLSGLAHNANAIPIKFGIVPDDEGKLREAVKEALEKSDVLLISGGSSVGTRDVTLDVIESFEDAKILAHGVSIRPGKPVIASVVGDKYLFGMPGNPVSVMIVFEIFITPLLQSLSGLQLPPWDAKETKAKLSTNFSSAPGREDYLRVRLVETADGFLAEPVLGKSALISTMVKADGTVKIPIGVEGLEAGEVVTVSLF